MNITANKHRHPQRALSRAGRRGRTLALSAALALGTLAAAGQASAQERAVHISIPAQPLGKALLQLGEQTSLQIFFPQDMVDGLNAPAVSGDLAPEQALRALLRDTSLTYRRQGNNVTLARGDAGAAVAQMPTVAVSAQGVDPVVQRVNPPTSVGSKTPLTQREIPQSVSVIGAEQIQKQQMRTLDEAMRYVPGVNVELANPLMTSYASRGFPIDTFQLDGVPTAIPAGASATIADNLAMYEQVEVLRGPAGLYNGFGGDGGVINLVRKRAPAAFQGSAEVTGGSRDTARAQVDLGGPLNDAGTLRGRIVGATAYQHLMQDGTWQRDRQFYGTLEADLTPTTQARIGLSHTETTGKPAYGIPYYSDGKLIDVRRSLYLGADWNHLRNDRTNAFAEVEQQLGGDWKAKIAYNYLQLHSHFLYGIPGGPVDRETDVGNPYSYNYENRDEQHAIDMYATGPFKLFGRTHQLTVGANYLHENSHNTQRFVNTATTGLDDWGDYYENIFTSNPLYSNDFDGGARNDNRTMVEQFGVYGNARFKLADPLTLVAGGRFTWWRSKLTPNGDPYYNYFGASASDTRVNGKFSPIVGLIYDIDDTYSAYASYTSIFKPQSGFYTVNGQIIKPVQGKQYEVGLKGTYLDGKANASVALFQIDESNRAFSDPNNPGFYLAQGKARSQGVELQVSGQVTPSWTVYAGYTYQDVRALDKSTNVGAPFIANPKHLFKVATDYRLPGDLRAWSVGAAAYVTSSTGFDGSPSTTAPGYATVDAHVSYQFLKTWTATLSATNLFDRKYYSVVEGAAGNYYGNPRTVLLSLRTTF
ncbi:TonB-dependent siderophore receptor [Bordetella genomosp. 10]|uniref:TonB-dependent siderophore receptor n=1 Tax=Bordetella genomosp. 10 TaxID=1416804 RepID=UPI001177C3EF|nr:TonB-dependent receptor [Bordetella genomosp. 10]